ncbi:MAG: AAA family ATPase [Deltaproteobacteria bacterium]|nr:AAA family ATPase [Deltaproteobacteria bacterium]
MSELYVQRFRAKAFKTLDDVSLELGRVNVFVGANGSGKTNVLEAIGILGAAAAGRVDDETLRTRGVRPGLPDRYRTCFPAPKLNAQIRFEAEADTARYDVGLWHRADANAPAWRYHAEYLGEGKVKLVGRSPALQRNLDPEAGLAALESVNLGRRSSSSILLRRLRNYRIFAPTTPHLRGLLPDASVGKPLGLAGGRLADALAELFETPRGKRAKTELLRMIGWASDIDVAPPEQAFMSRAVPAVQRVVRFTDKFMQEGHDQLSAYDASEGALYALFAAVLALHRDAPKLFAVDNFDQALNPRFARALMKAFSEWILGSNVGRQALLTVHNPLVLDGLPIGNDDVRLFAVDRTESGRTAVERKVITPEMVALAQDGWTLSRMWVEGLLGGVPNV